MRSAASCCCLLGALRAAASGVPWDSEALIGLFMLTATLLDLPLPEVAVAGLFLEVLFILGLHCEDSPLAAPPPTAPPARPVGAAAPQRRDSMTDQCSGSTRTPV